MMSRGFPSALSARSRRSFTLFWAALFVMSLGLQYGSLASPPTTLAGDKTEINICHGTGSQSNPYVFESPAINSSGAFAGELAAGHNDHVGPLWFPGITVVWGDIIPPYTYAPANFSYPGLNWTTAGQAIYNNGCNIPNPHLSITKTSTTTGFSTLGDVIHYDIVATNTGNTTLAAVTVTDPNANAGSLVCVPVNGSPLAPDASMTAPAGPPRSAPTSPRRAPRTRTSRSPRRPPRRASASSVTSSATRSPRPTTATSR